MSPSFNLSQLNTAPRLPPQLPTAKPAAPQEGPWLNVHEKMEGKADKEVFTLRKQSLYERIFGKRFGSGDRFRTKRIGGWFGSRDLPGFKSSLYALKKDRQNLSDRDITLMSHVVERVMKELPHYIARQGEDASLPPFARKKILSHLWEEVKNGNLSYVNFEEAEKIVKQMKV